MGSLDYMQNFKENVKYCEDSLIKRHFNKVLWGATLILGGFWYLWVVHSSGETDPIKGIEKMYMQYEYHRRSFGKDGLADQNKDGRISFSEREDLWERMKLDYRAQPEFEDLERAIKSYENEAKATKSY